jgi:hypothetical protein
VSFPKSSLFRDLTTDSGNFCVAGKPVPVITTDRPIDPVVADTPVITGAGAAVELTETEFIARTQSSQ